MIQKKKSEDRFPEFGFGLWVGSGTMAQASTMFFVVTLP